jgi:hypothetical protein
MEQDRPIFRIFIMIMIIEFVATFLGYSRMFLPFTLDNVQYFTIYHFIISIITFIINPISVLIGFYYLGKKLDLKSNLKPVIVRLLIGAYLGQFISFTLLYLIGIYLIEGYSFYWLSYLSSILSVSFLGLFFAAFTALAIAHLKQTD